MKPTTTFAELAELCQKTNKKIYEISQEEESSLLECTEQNVRKRVQETLKAMQEAINEGLKSDEKSASKMVGADCAKLKKYYEKNEGLFSQPYQNIIKYALATSEQNARMGKIAACPTAGACGIVPAAMIGIGTYLKVENEILINALLTAGIIGRIISEKTALAGAVGGCQSECGVASAMAAGAVVEILGGNAEQIINAVALALKNVLGLVCDPIAGLVEVPCVKRNPFLAIHALTAAELALADIKSFVPADEVVDALKQIGALMSPTLKESAQAGLATTPSAIKITEELNKTWQK